MVGDEGKGTAKKGKVFASLDAENTRRDCVLTMRRKVVREQSCSWCEVAFLMRQDKKLCWKGKENAPSSGQEAWQGVAKGGPPDD